MDAKQIRRVGRALPRFLGGFRDCFGRCDTRRYLKVYVDGQMSELHRKSVEPMALRAGVPPRSLQAFLSLLEWDEHRLVDRLQQGVARDHAHPWAIGIVDETGCGKDGRHTACVQRQWCGALGKVENCVVSVHTGYAVGSFHCVLDSDLFVPKAWADDSVRRQEVGMPDDVTHRSKPEIALQQIQRALANGVRAAAWTFDELYGGSYDFLDGLDRLGQTYVTEVPCTFHGWVKEPAVLYRSTPQERRQHGRSRRFPRLSKTAAPVSEVRNLLNHSPAFQDQAWIPVHIKNGEKGAIVREVKAVRFFMRRHALPTRPHWLIVTRDPQSRELKFFVSNASAGAPLEWLLYVAYARWPIEQCFREEKDELGFDHFEVRGWQAIHRHLYLSQVSHLFANQMRQQLVGEESVAPDTAPGTAGPFSPWDRAPAGVSAAEPDRRSGPLRPVAVVPGPALRSNRRRSDHSRRGCRLDPLPAPSQQRGQGQPHANPTQETPKNRHRCRSNQVVPG